MNNNLLDIDSLGDSGQELFEVLLESGGFRLERIVSFGQVTPEGEWYDQDLAEWVSVVQGFATLEYEDGERVDFKVGDYVQIPPHRKHRVVFTSDDCIWLALHYKYA